VQLVSHFARAPTCLHHLQYTIYQAQDHTDGPPHLVTSACPCQQAASTNPSCLPHPPSYSSGVSYAVSQESRCTQRPRALLQYSFHTWSALSHTCRASYPAARSISRKQCAHSPHLHKVVRRYESQRRCCVGVVTLHLTCLPNIKDRLQQRPSSSSKQWWFLASAGSLTQEVSRIVG
jgi:hypothetical protein